MIFLSTKCKSKWSQNSVIRNLVRKLIKLPTALSKEKSKKKFKKELKEEMQKTRMSSNGQKNEGFESYFYKIIHKN